ncbi:hypothetical protein ABT215_12980 [Streptomyces sp900105755]|uniref:hypothetical protein n=1 Tax=Streptomyces sp. 900105755 TaxID=3154389 RepID=UPI00332A0667
MAASEIPAGLNDRGRRLWRDSLEQGPLTPAQLVILEEACRISDRLDLLDFIIRGQMAGVNAEEQSSGDFQRWLAEARQQSATLRALLGEISSKSAASKTAEPAPDAKGAAGVSDLSARIAARRTKPAR